ncbi:MAG: UDP-N-acetylglucosamine--N-acetylmuramyl-(pentapeptide) pyrophosphoryl-undecaprenol N-acetylglucosamine transferase [Clostridia bacterium]|nr:UDP-N-acetylglucosamine--N-acetylmuramyl-(pentapeptide) pyrophosphoryl-undecaprenol N-acetylglucosamine transferase [Clostridia bacterium]
MKKIAFTGGGSAGHVVPNLALMEEILKSGRADVCYFGTDGIEKSLVAAQGAPYFSFACPKLIRGKSWRAFQNNAKIPFRFWKSVKAAELGLKEFSPDVVFSKGGYVALPVVTAAARLGIPCFTHESDLSAGLANKLIAKKCKAVFTSFPETAERFKNGKFSGAPMRASLFQKTKSEGKRAFGIKTDRKVLLNFGGGSGSQVINEAVRNQLAKLTSRYFVLHVCGKGNVAFCNFENYRQTEFIADMGAAYAAADLIVSRAGAGAIFEIIALKKPAIFVPLESASRGDQKQNAAYFQNKGLCRVLSQSNLSQLTDELLSLEKDDALRERLATADFQNGNGYILKTLAPYLQ